MTLRAIIYVLILSVAPACCADNGATLPRSEQHEIIQEIIQHSGLLGLGLQARTATQQALLVTQAPLTKQYEVVKAMAALWAPAQIKQTLGQILATYDPPQLQSLQQALHTDVLVKAQAKEQQAIDAQQGEAYRHYIEQLRRQPPPLGRRSAMRQLDVAMHFSPLLKQVRAAVFTELDERLPTWQQPAAWEQALEQDALDYLFYVHRSTPDAELEHLTAIYQTPALQHWLGQVEAHIPATKHSLAAAK